MAHWPETGPESGGAHSGKRPLKWIGATQGAKTQIIQPGDLLTLRIWDSSDNSLLTTPDEKMVQLQDVTVAANGSIFMPYVGNVNVNGLTPDLAREKLQTAMEEIVPSAQLQLDMTEGRGNSVDLVSGVETPGTYPMPDRNYTVMGLIAAGGGISASLNNPQIRLVRGRSIYGTSVETLLNDPRRDTLLRGGDRVFVEEDARYFLSFGATGREDLHTFTKDQMSAMDAMSVAGGFQDSRADPQGLLVLREYPDSALAPGQRGPRQPRVVFTLDLTSADGLFSARRFQINSGDLLIATEAPVNDALTISNIIGNFFGVFSRAGAL
ncbi:polysaccharide biosynthesis/export family protein [Phaeobacter piscinae]|uniref:polysaccharide biosynthesis/export family protein n=1 Tax=Phaeobacter piscinae TaxID=1580596 RepID=UPI0039F6A61D